MKRVLLLGSEGQIGWELQRTLAVLGDVYGFDKDTLDILDTVALKAVVERLRPDVIVNAAAYTAVDKAEEEHAACWQLNAEVPASLAALAKRYGSLLVHYSTDYIFDGRGTSPYDEDAMTGPLSVYGASKLAGEDAIRSSGVAHLILRTSWIYATRGKNFLLTMLELAERRQSLSIVADQVGAPTWARLVAEATAQMIGKVQEPLYGTYNVTCGGITTWYDFAGAIFRGWQELVESRGFSAGSIPTLQAITTEEYPTAAIRPSYSVLSNDKLNKNFGIQLSDWQTALRLCQEELILIKRHKLQGEELCIKVSS